MYLLGLDIGTSGTKTVLFTETGETVASCTVEYPMFQPKNGYAEQDPADWWNAVVQSIREVMSQSGVKPVDVKSIGLSGQMHGLVMLDSSDEVIRNAIIWCDQRTAAECAEITGRVGERRLLEITANPALTGFTASKILWVRNHEPQYYERCRHILLPKDYIRFMLTGEFATEVSDASGMQLLDIEKRCWSDEVLSALEIDKSLLGTVYESPEVTGKLSARGAELTGLLAGTLVVGGAGDCAAGAVGTGVVRDGKAYTTIGTSGVVFAHTSKMATDLRGRVHTFCTAVPGAWHVMGVTQGAGLSLKWFRDQFCRAESETAALLGVDPYYILDKQADMVPIGADKLLYLPYLMGERTPHLDPDARGVFFGLSAMHTKNHLLRAIMEGVSYSLMDCLSIFDGMNITVQEMMACGGGGSSSFWRQMLADVYGCPVHTVNAKEGPALGVALLAGVGVGAYSSIEEACAAVIRPDKTCDFDAAHHEQYQKMYGLYGTLYPAMKESFAALGQM